MLLLVDITSILVPAHIDHFACLWQSRERCRSSALASPAPGAKEPARGLSVDVRRDGLPPCFALVAV